MVSGKTVSGGTFEVPIESFNQQQLESMPLNEKNEGPRLRRFPRGFLDEKEREKR